MPMNGISTILPIKIPTIVFVDIMLVFSEEVLDDEEDDKLQPRIIMLIGTAVVPIAYNPSNKNCSGALLSRSIVSTNNPRSHGKDAQIIPAIAPITGG